MAINTWDTLKSSISTWLNRSDLDSQIPDFIKLAEADFNIRIRTSDMMKRATTIMNSEYISAPGDYLALRNVQLNTSPVKLLDYLTPEELDEKAQIYTSSGKPRFFSLVADTIQVLPSPDTNYTAEVAYYSEILPLSADNADNWLLRKHPSVYLYGSLFHSAPFLMSDERLPVWEKLMNESIATLNQADVQSRYSGNTPKMSFSSFGY